MKPSWRSCRYAVGPRTLPLRVHPPRAMSEWHPVRSESGCHLFGSISKRTLAMAMPPVGRHAARAGGTFNLCRDYSAGRSAMFGIAFEGSNMMEKLGLPNIRGIASFVARDDKTGRREASRFANRSVMEKRRLYGAKATTNQGLGFISEKVARTKVCRKAAKQGRRKVCEHQEKAALEKLRAFQAATTQEERREIFRSVVSVPGVQVARYA